VVPVSFGQLGGAGARGGVCGTVSGLICKRAYIPHDRIGACSIAGATNEGQFWLHFRRELAENLQSKSIDFGHSKIRKAKFCKRSKKRERGAEDPSLQNSSIVANHISTG